MDDLKTVIGRNINAQLAIQDIKQYQLAEVLGVTANTISYFCAGKRTPNYEQLIKIADFLNVSVDSLLGHTPRADENDRIQTISNMTGLTVNAVSHLLKCDSVIVSDFMEADGFEELFADIDDLYGSVFVLREQYEEQQSLEDFAAAHSIDLNRTEEDPEEEQRLRKLWEDRNSFIHIYDTVRLEKFELADAFAKLLERALPTEEILFKAKKLVREFGGLSASDQGGVDNGKRS